MLWLLAAVLGAAQPPAANTPPAADAPPASYTIDRWGTDEGLPNNALSSVIQSRDGYLWIATWAGTVRFDGVRFTPVAPNLPNDHVHALLEDGDRSIWMGVAGTGLVRWRAGRVLHVYTPDDGLAGTDVRALAKDASGRIWVATENGLSVLESGRILMTARAGQGLPDNAITGLSAGQRGRIWIATKNGICQATYPRIECTKRRSFDGHTSGVLEDRTGRLWIGTDEGLFVEPSPEADAPCGRHGCYRGTAVASFLEARDGSVFAGLGDGRVARIAQGAITDYGPADGLPGGGGPVVALAEDVEGSIWVATFYGGLGRLKPKRVTTYTTANGLPAKAIGSIVQDHDGRIWVGAQCGPVSEFVNGGFVPRFAQYTKNACAWVLWPTRDGALWIGTRGDGLFRWFRGRMEHFGRAEGLSDTHVCGLFEDRDGVLWIGTELGGLHTYTNGRLSRAFGTQDGVATPYLASFAQDREGRVWIGSNANGLTVYDHGRFHRLTGADAPPSANIANLSVDGRGDLWMGTASRGLFRRRNGRFEPFGPEQGLGDRLVAVLIEDGDGTMWVATSRGISRLTRDRIDDLAEGRRPSLDPIVLDRTDGMINTEGSGGGLDPSGLRDRDGRLWFSTIDGIVVVDPSTFRLNPVAPRVLVEDVSVNGRPITPDANGTVDVPAGASIEAHYTAFSFLAPQKMRFRYRLGGLDAQWQDVGARRTAYFTRVPPGSYTFEVLACNNDGVWTSSPAVVSLVVAPFWWQRPSVEAAGVAFLALASAIVVRRVSLRRARARVAELEREGALARERSRIARDLHDDIGTRLSYIAVMADSGSFVAHPRIAQAARDAARTMDELVWAMNTRNDTVEGFAFYLAQFAEEHIVAAGVRCRVMLPPVLPTCRLGAEVRRQLYLACKEAVNNAVRHAHPSEIRVLLRAEDTWLEVEVDDDGSGLPVGVGPTGNGLKNYRERMDAAGGTVQVESAPDRGTRVIFCVPLTT